MRKENSLLKREANDAICGDCDGKVALECICGLVLSGKTDSSNPPLTPGGSVWTNDASSLRNLPARQDPRTYPRNECIRQGYASMAVVPIRAKGQVIGLLQLNDHGKQTVEVTVSDCGHGIAAGKLTQVFQPFFTTKSAGLGMGLGISQSIIQLHGGRIWADNNPEGGATFRFTLKVAGGEGPVAGDERPAASMRHLPRARLMSGNLEQFGA